MHTKKILAAFLAVVMLALAIPFVGGAIGEEEITTALFETEEEFVTTVYDEPDYPYETTVDTYDTEIIEPEYNAPYLSLELYEVTEDKIVVDLYTEDYDDPFITLYDLMLRYNELELSFSNADCMYDCTNSYMPTRIYGEYGNDALQLITENEDQFPAGKTHLWRIEFEILIDDYLREIEIWFDMDNSHIRNTYGYDVEDYTEYTSVYYTYDFLPAEHSFEIVNGILTDYAGPGGEVVIPDSVTEIGYGAFAGMQQITSVIIPDSVITIGERAFSGCENLADITIPDSITKIGEKAFYRTAYYYDDSNWDDSDLYIGNHLIDIRSNVWGNFVIKDGTVTIADGVLYNIHRYNVIYVPKSVKNIGEGVFIGCENNGNSTLIVCYRNSPTHTYVVENNLRYELVVCDDHKETEMIGKVDATCTANGYTGDIYCVECGTLITSGETVPATGHTPGEWEVVTEATETAEGLRVIKCTICGEEISRETIPVIVPEHTPGDATGDDKVTLADATLMLKYIAKWDVQLDTNVADVTGDGKVTLADVTLILKYIANWDVTLK